MSHECLNIHDRWKKDFFHEIILPEIQSDTEEEEEEKEDNLQTKRKMLKVKRYSCKER